MSRRSKALFSFLLCFSHNIYTIFTRSNLLFKNIFFSPINKFLKQFWLFPMRIAFHIIINNNQARENNFTIQACHTASSYYTHWRENKICMHLSDDRDTFDRIGRFCFTANNFFNQYSITKKVHATYMYCVYKLNSASYLFLFRSHIRVPTQSTERLSSDAERGCYRFARNLRGSNYILWLILAHWICKKKLTY